MQSPTTMQLQTALEAVRVLASNVPTTIPNSIAMIANGAHECGWFKHMHELGQPTNRGGLGVWQWTGVRRRQFEAWCTVNEANPRSIAGSIRYLVHELEGPEGRVIAQMNAVSKISDKTIIFCTTFERPGVPHLDRRVAISALIDRTMKLI